MVVGVWLVPTMFQVRGVWVGTADRTLAPPSPLSVESVDRTSGASGKDTIENLLHNSSLHSQHLAVCCYADAHKRGKSVSIRLSLEARLEMRPL